MKYFPYVHLLALIVGGIVLLILKKKYQKMRNRELIIIFILYLILVALFTEPVMDYAKKIMLLIQLH